jgi:hypothetical protein
MQIDYLPDAKIHAAEFLGLFRENWPGEFDAALVQAALDSTFNITARESDLLVGCLRIISDGYFLATVPEVLIRKGYQKSSISRRLLELAFEFSPTNLLFAVQPVNDAMMHELGWRRGLPSYVIRKELPKFIWRG